jgi:predicted AAA+ superfamily ATPase
MRTMTHWEMGWSPAEISLKDLMNGATPRAGAPEVSFEQLTQRLTKGGWPGFRSLTAQDVSANLADYLDSVATVDLRMVDGVRRDPLRVRRLLGALARSVASEVTLTTLARDETSLTRDAVRDYLSALERIFIVEDQPASSTHLRSSATLRQEPKRHFADPSLAVAALNASPKALRRDPAFTGQLFESLVVHDLRVFAQPLRGVVSHTRDSTGREVDAIISLPNGQWAGFEVKLGSSKETIDAAANALLSFANQVVDEPVSLNIVTLSGPSYRRRDGVNVIAFNSLGP